MKYLLALATTGLFLTLNVFAEDKAPDIRIIDNKVSVQAEAVPLARLLRLLGEVTGMESKVPPELANRNVSVRFSNLSFADAVQKIFEGQPLDYFMIEGKSITVTGLAQNPAAAARTAGTPAPAPQQENVFVDDNPPFNPQPPINNGNQPAMIQTPFGAIANPNARPGQQQQQQQIQQPMVQPGQYPQANPFGNSLPTMNNGLNNGINNQPNNGINNQVPGLQPVSPFGQQPTTISPGINNPNVPNGFPANPIQGNPFPANPPRPNP